MWELKCMVGPCEEVDLEWELREYFGWNGFVELMACGTRMVWDLNWLGIGLTVGICVIVELNWSRISAGRE